MIDIVEELRFEENLFHRAADEIERLRNKANGWQAQAAGISQDLSNAQDQIERLREQILKLHSQILRMELAEIHEREARHG